MKRITNFFRQPFQRTKMVIKKGVIFFIKQSEIGIGINLDGGVHNAERKFDKLEGYGVTRGA